MCILPQERHIFCLLATNYISLRNSWEEGTRDDAFLYLFDELADDCLVDDLILEAERGTGPLAALDALDEVLEAPTTEPLPTSRRTGQDPLLTSERQYHADIAPYTRYAQLSPEHKQGLVERARQGDTKARTDIIHCLLQSVECFAVSYFHTYSWASARLEYLDLIGIGNEVLSAHLDRALATDHPYAYLLSSAYGAMRKYCWRYSSLIVTPTTTGITPKQVESLDTPLSETNASTLADLLADQQHSRPAAPRQDYHILHQAMDALPPIQHTLITRLFGLHDAGIAEDIREISQQLYGESSRQAISRAFVLKTKALNHLYSLLASQYPHTGDGTIPPQRQQRQDYAQLSNSPAHQQRLALAVADLQASGHKLTQNALEKVTHIRGPIVGAYLQQQGLAQPDRELRLEQALTELQESCQHVTVGALKRTAHVATDSATLFLQQRGLIETALTRQQRLEQALSELQESCQSISGRRLAATAGVCKATANAFLLQQAGRTAAQ
jgi:hypothetical protein